MSNYERDADQLRIRTDVSWGCASGIGISVFSIIGVIALGLLGFLASKGQIDTLFYVLLIVVFICLGLALLIFKARGKARTESTLIFDRQSEIFTFFKNESAGKYRIHYSDLSHVLIKKLKFRSHSSSGSVGTLRSEFHIFLVKRDGSYFWVDDFHFEDHRTVKSIADYIDIDIIDETDLGLGRHAGSTYKKRVVEIDEYIPKFVTLQNVMVGKSLIISSFTDQGLTGKSKDFLINVSETSLQIDALNFSRDQILNVRLYRLLRGDFWLSIHLNHATQAEWIHVPTLDWGYQESFEDVYHLGKDVIGLWRVSGGTQYGLVTDYDDLHFIENTLKKSLQLP